MKALLKKTEIDVNGIKYRKSSFSDIGKHCVGVNISDKKITVINTKIPNSAVLEFTPKEWQAFLFGVKNQEFDIHSHEETE